MHFTKLLFFFLGIRWADSNQYKKIFGELILRRLKRFTLFLYKVFSFK